MELRLNKLVKVYADKIALNNFNMIFNEGIYGIIGPNGAGKSTLVNLITDNVKRDSGEILFNGEEVLELKERFRQKVGFMPQQQGFYEHFTAISFLKYMAKLKGIDNKSASQQIENLLDIVNLHDAAHDKIKTFSGGMRQRVLLAQALLGEPDIIILDEPTAGLDPSERIRIRNFISEISRNKIILFATHVVSDIESIADEVLLIEEGRLIQKAAPAELIQSIDGKVAEISCKKEDISLLQKQYIAGNVKQRQNGLFMRIVGDNLPQHSKVPCDQIDLEDVYLYYFQTT